MPIRTLRGACLALGLAAIMAGGTEAGTIINGDFETGNLTGWNTFTTTNGTIGTPSVAPFDVTGAGSSPAARLDPGVELPARPGLNDGGGLSQSFTVAGGDYTFSADVAAYFDGVAGSTNDDGGTFALLLDDVVLRSIAFGPIDGQQTLRGTLSSVVTGLSGGTHELKLLVTRSRPAGGVAAYFDNVGATQILPLAVPEPSTLALGGIGAAIGLAAARRRRGTPPARS